MDTSRVFEVDAIGPAHRHRSARRLIRAAIEIERITELTDEITARLDAAEVTR